MEVFGIRLNDYSGEALSALFVILIFLGVWRPGREVKMWQAAAERSAQQVDKLTKAFQDLVAAVKQPSKPEEHNGEQPSSREADPP